MTIINWLTDSMKILVDAGADSPRRDCLVLLEDLVKKDRSWVIAHPEHKLTTRQVNALNKLIARRVKREPLAYIRGRAWFFGRFFDVNPEVLIPRPESESFVTMLKPLHKQLCKDSPCSIVDIGTGSGAIAISTKLEIPDANIVATDIDEKVLKVARKNAKNHKTDVRFINGSLLEPVYKRRSKLRNLIIATNLPYVPDGLVTSPEINYEPGSALFSGRDGLDHYRRFWKQVKNYPLSAPYILTESLEDQHQDMEKFALAAGYKLVKINTLIQLFSPAK